MKHKIFYATWPRKGVQEQTQKNCTWFTMVLLFWFQFSTHIYIYIYIYFFLKYIIKRSNSWDPSWKVFFYHRSCPPSPIWISRVSSLEPKKVRQKPFWLRTCHDSHGTNKALGWIFFDSGICTMLAHVRHTSDVVVCCLLFVVCCLLFVGGGCCCCCCCCCCCWQ